MSQRFNACPIDLDLRTGEPGSKVILDPRGCGRTPATHDEGGGCSMETFANVLCAIDLSDEEPPISGTAELVLRAADREARLHGATLAVIHALPVDAGAPMSPAAVEQAMIQRQKLGSELTGAILSEVERITGRPAGGVKVLIEDGPAQSAIVETAARIGAELIVVGHQGARGLRRLLLGSVATAVVREARFSVLVVRGR